GAGRPHQTEEFTGPNIQRDIVERRHVDFALAINLGQIANGDYFCRGPRHSVQGLVRKSTIHRLKKLRPSLSGSVVTAGFATAEKIKPRMARMGTDKNVRAVNGRKKAHKPQKEQGGV